jgi:hypothetical protein
VHHQLLADAPLSNYTTMIAERLAARLATSRQNWEKRTTIRRFLAVIHATTK